MNATTNGHGTFTTMDDLRLIDSEAGLHKMYDLRKSADLDTSALTSAHDLLTKEMAARGLYYEPLEKATASVPIIAPVVAPASVDRPWTVAELIDLAKAVVDLPSAERFTKAVGDLSVEDRQKYAQQGIALPDGSFPIPDEAHLHAAVKLQSQASDPQAAMNHIIERAKAMGMDHVLPQGWKDASAKPPDGQPSVGVGPNSQYPDAPKPAKSGVVAKLRKALGLTEAESNVILKVLDAELEDDSEYLILKSAPEDRYTLGPMYFPDQIDAHGEWVSADDLEKSMWSYVEKSAASGRDVFLQHNPTVSAGKWVSIMPWPYEVTATVRKSIDGVVKADSTVFPPGTTYMGILWSEDAWPLVKSGQVTGLSMGGHARRVPGTP